MKYKKHVLGPGETIRGIIRKYNKQTVDADITQLLSEVFFKKNSKKVFKVGEEIQIPLYDFLNTPKPTLAYTNLDFDKKQSKVDDNEKDDKVIEKSKLKLIHFSESDIITDEKEYQDMVKRDLKRQEQRRINNLILPETPDDIITEEEGEEEDILPVLSEEEIEIEKQRMVAEKKREEQIKVRKKVAEQTFQIPPIQQGKKEKQRLVDVHVSKRHKRT